MPITREKVIYETERLILKPTDVEDAPFLLKLLNSPGWLEHIGDRNVHTIVEAINYIDNKMTDQYNRLGYGNFTVITKATKTKVGTSGIYQRPGMDDVDIGFSVLPGHMGKGYSYEAATKMMDLAEHEFGIKKITAVTTKANFASQNLIKKLGLKFIKEVNWPDDPETLLQYAKEF